VRRFVEWGQPQLVLCGHIHESRARTASVAAQSSTRDRRRRVITRSST
jgi:hypothetical protein